MGALTRLAHTACLGISRGGYRRYREALNDVRGVQEAIYHRLLALSAGSEHGRRLGLEPGTSLEAFRRRVPVSEYDQWRPLVERQRREGGRIVSGTPCDRYQPTSGSTSRVKWIPYTAEFLHELNQAIEPWMGDLYRLEPRIRRGRHYWSLSWVPTSLRRQVDRNVNDDMGVLPLTTRIFMTLTAAVPAWVAYAPSSEASMFANLCHLAACRDLSLISVWSPTFALNLLEGMAERRLEIAEALASGRWGAAAAGLERPCPRSPRAAALLREWDGRPTPEFLRSLWPRLGLISAWDTSTSARWAAISSPLTLRPPGPLPVQFQR